MYIPTIIFYTNSSILFFSLHLLVKNTKSKRMRKDNTMMTLVKKSLGCYIYIKDKITHGYWAVVSNSITHRQYKYSM